MPAVAYRGKPKAQSKGKAPAIPAWLTKAASILKQIFQPKVQPRTQGPIRPYKGPVYVPGGLSAQQRINATAAIKAGKPPSTAYRGAVGVPGGISQANRQAAIAQMQAGYQASVLDQQRWAQRYTGYGGGGPKSQPMQPASTYRPYPALRPSEAGPTAAIRSKIPGWRGGQYTTPVPYAPKPQPVLHINPYEETAPGEYDYGGGGYGGYPSYPETQYTYPEYTGPAQYQRYRGQVPYRNDVPRWLAGLVTWRF